MLVFQYGSNMSSERLNHVDRLNGDAKVVCVASTVDTYDFAFTVWSKTNECAAADIVPNPDGRTIMGVLYDIPGFLLTRDSARSCCRKSLDAIEGEGRNYRRIDIELLDPSGHKISATTYVVRERKEGLKTSRAYSQHIVDGLLEHGFPEEYRRYVICRIEQNNPELREAFGV